MKTIACALAAATMMSAGPVHAAKAQIEQMLKLSPETRIEQRCDARAMGAVQREHKGFKPDEFVAYAFTDPILRGSKNHRVWRSNPQQREMVPAFLYLRDQCGRSGRCGVRLSARR
jgi:hypothetical protein